MVVESKGGKLFLAQYLAHMCSNSSAAQAEDWIQNLTQAYARSSRRPNFLCLFTKIYLSNKPGPSLPRRRF